MATICRTHLACDAGETCAYARVRDEMQLDLTGSTASATSSETRAAVSSNSRTADFSGSTEAQVEWSPALTYDPFEDDRAVPAAPIAPATWLLPWQMPPGQAHFVPTYWLVPVLPLPTVFATVGPQTAVRERTVGQCKLAYESRFREEANPFGLEPMKE
eukprot:TRINITY_DN47750_c0_g1_i1.p1 TRINITY_DN47750_c0_g1~~TRINITY_DN47750_c0_g1_i1.p1  ORF type:complete len:159 (-),score=15.76 TRINITY_DN47750_c0_g1_i1:131-607(-)